MAQPALVVPVGGEAGKIKIRVKTITNETFDVTVSPDALVGSLKTLVKDSSSVSEERQRLIFRGRVMQDQDKISTYKIEDGHTIHLVARPVNRPQPAEASPRNAAASTTSSNSDDLGLGLLSGGGGGGGGGLSSNSLATLSAALGLGGGGLLSGGGGSSTARRLAGRSSDGSLRLGGGLGLASNSRAAAPPQPHRRPLEHVRQGLMTMHTLLASTSHPDTTTTGVTPNVTTAVTRTATTTTTTTTTTTATSASAAAGDDGGGDSGDMVERSGRTAYPVASSPSPIPSPKPTLSTTPPPPPPSSASSPTLRPLPEVEAEEHFEECKGMLDEPASKAADDNSQVSCAFYVGQWLDAKDTVNQWLEATVMDINASRAEVMIHYNGWPTRWDEWISWTSVRLAPFRTRTVHSIHSPFVSPSPVSPVHNAPHTGDDDVRLLLPEVSRMMNAVRPLMSQLESLCLEQLELETWQDDDQTAAAAATTTCSNDFNNTNTAAATTNTNTTATAAAAAAESAPHDGAARLAPASAAAAARDMAPAAMPRGTATAVAAPVGSLSDGQALPWVSNSVHHNGQLKRRRRPRARHATLSPPAANNDVRAQVVDDIEAAAHRRLEALQAGEPWRQRQISQASAALAPLVDRLGRLVADLGPHLQALGEHGGDHAAAAAALAAGRSGLETSSGSLSTGSLSGTARGGVSRSRSGRARLRARSPAPETAYQQLIATPARSGLPSPPQAGGNVDIHIHAILTPLRTTTAPTAPASAPATTASNPTAATVSADANVNQETAQTSTAAPAPALAGALPMTPTTSATQDRGQATGAPHTAPANTGASTGNTRDTDPPALHELQLPPPASSSTPSSTSPSPSNHSPIPTPPDFAAVAVGPSPLLSPDPCPPSDQLVPPTSPILTPNSTPTPSPSASSSAGAPAAGAGAGAAGGGGTGTTRRASGSSPFLSGLLRRMSRG